MVRGRYRRRGAVIIITLGILLVLSILAISFARLMVPERDAAKSHNDAVRARFAATSGVEVAISRLQRVSLSELHTAHQWNRPPSGTWVFQDWAMLDDTGTRVDTIRDLQGALFPSFRADIDGDGSFENGVSSSTDDLVYGRAVSGVVPNSQGSTEPSGLTYSLKVSDLQGRLNLNLDLPIDRLAKILDTLGKFVSIDFGFEDPVAGASYVDGATTYTNGMAIARLREDLAGGRFVSSEQVIQVLGVDGSGVSKFEILRHFVTTESWVDDRTIEPQPSATPSDQLSLVVSARHPVNINTAPRPVLVALLEDLRGYRRAFRGGASITGIEAYKIGPASDSMKENHASSVAAAIVVNRGLDPTVGGNPPYAGPFRSWGQFEAFMRDLENFANQFKTLINAFGGGASDGHCKHVSKDKPWERDSVLANANPNPWLNRFHSDAARYRTMDKADLSVWSTEFCFSSMGRFEVESIGRVTRNGGEIAGQYTIVARLQILDTFRVTNQSDFQSIRTSTNATGTETWLESVGDTGGVGDGYRADGFVQMLEPETIWSPQPAADGNLKQAEMWVSYTNGFRCDANQAGDPDLQGWPAAGNNKVEGVSILAGSDLGAAGIMMNSYRQRCGVYNTASEHIDVDEGSFEMWLKVDRDLLKGTASWLPLVGWHHESIGGRFGGTGFVAEWVDLFDGETIVIRRLFGQSPFGPGNVVSPYFYDTAIHVFDISDWNSQEWHHLAFSWGVRPDGFRDAMWQDVWVDGQSTPIVTRYETCPSFCWTAWTLEPHADHDRIYLGDAWYTALQAGSEWKAFVNLTLDAVKAYGDGTVFRGASFPLPSRYRDNPVLPATFEGALPTVAWARRLGGVTWTEHFPDRWKSASYAPGDFDLVVEIWTDDGKGWQTLTKNVDWTSADGSGSLPGVRESNGNLSDGRSYYAPGNIDWVNPRTVPANTEIRFRVRFENPGGVSPLLVSSVLDDLSFFIYREPKLLQWGEGVLD